MKFSKIPLHLSHRLPSPLRPRQSHSVLWHGRRASSETVGLRSGWSFVISYLLTLFVYCLVSITLATYIYIRMYLIYDYNYNPQIITIVADMFPILPFAWLWWIEQIYGIYSWYIYIYTYIFMKWRFYDELIVLYKTFKKTPFMPYNLLSKLCPLAWSTAWICDSNSNPS